METKCLGDATIYFRHTERQTAALIEEVYARSVPLLHSMFGLRPAKELRFVVLATHWGFVRHCIPRRQKALVLVYLPFTLGQIKRIFAAGCSWTAEHKDHVLVGVKAIQSLGSLPELLQTSWADPTSPALSGEEWLRAWVRGQIIGACCQPYRLPDWLHAGIAGLIRDHVSEPPSKPAGLARLLERFGTLDMEVAPLCNPEQANSLPQEARDKLAAPDFLAYWVTRFIEESRPGLIRSLFQSGCRGKAFEREIAAALGIDPTRFAADVVKLAAAHFRQTEPLAAAETGTSATTSDAPAGRAEEEHKAPAIQSTSKTFRSGVPIGSVVLLGVLFSVWAFLSISTWLCQAADAVPDAGTIAIITGVLCGLLAMLPLCDLLRPRKTVEVNDECITLVSSPSRRKTLRWDEVASIKEVEQGHYLELRNADRSVVIRLDPQLQKYSELVQIIVVKTRWSPLGIAAKQEVTAAVAAEVALPATFYPSWEQYATGLGLVAGFVLSVVYFDLNVTYGVVAMALIALPLSMFQWRTIGVSADSIVIQYPLRRKQIAMSDICEMRIRGFKKPELVLVLCDGRTVTIKGVRGGVGLFYRALLAVGAAEPESGHAPHECESR
jgi:hypothetical protein